jgi:hypothetical protein
MFTALSTGQWTGVVFDLLLADFFRQFFKLIVVVMNAFASSCYSE